MSTRLPYEDNLSNNWKELPLPDEDQAWLDMKRRLDEDEDRPGIVWWRRGCMLWGLLLGLGVLIAWWFLDPPQWLGGKQKNNELSGQTVDSVSNKQDKPRGNKQSESEFLKDSIISQHEIGNDTTGPKKSNPSKTGENKTTDEPNDFQDRNRDHLKEQVLTTREENQNKLDKKSSFNKRTVQRKSLKINSQQDELTKKKSRKPVSSLPLDKSQPLTGIPTQPAKLFADSSDKKIDSLSVKNLPGTQSRTDSVITNKKIDSTKADSIVKVQPLPRQDSVIKKKNPVFLSAGLAVHQQLPVSGQKFTPYNSLGRKGTFRDYIPAVYLRINKEGKWFIQSEFRYGAPQYAKDIVYNQQEERDTIGGNNFTITTSNTLKKTYYHQLPVTFNYFVLPNWSVGAGLSWNKFSNAISGLDVVKSDNNTSIDSVITKTIVTDKNDSVFKKSYFQAIIESHYQFKRWSLGARYSFGLQPYLDFKIAGGTQKERSSSLQVFLRYELWRGKKK